jgi:hypothetical protein
VASALLDLASSAATSSIRRRRLITVVAALVTPSALADSAFEDRLGQGLQLRDTRRASFDDVT